MNSKRWRLKSITTYTKSPKGEVDKMPKGNYMETKCDISGWSCRNANWSQRISLFPCNGRNCREANCKVLNRFIKIYRRNCIRLPTYRLETDFESEFTNNQVCDFFLNSLRVMMKFREPGKHKQQLYAEQAIQAIQKPLLKHMEVKDWCDIRRMIRRFLWCS